MASDEGQIQEEPWFLKLKYSILFPPHPAFHISDAEFEEFVKSELADHGATPRQTPADDQADSFTDISTPPSTTADVREAVGGLALGETATGDETNPVNQDLVAEQHPFMKGLLAHGEAGEKRGMENMMQTENHDLAHRSTNDPLVDLFAELEEVISGPRLLELLGAAWAADPLVTLKIIFNARSIHLGKSSRTVFYRAAGWLAKFHPATLVANLRWLSRPVIPKKVEQKKDGEDDIVLVDAADADENDPAYFDVRHGVAHGYWKDLLNILALYVNGKLDALANPRDILNIEKAKDAPRLLPITEEQARQKRHAARDRRHVAAMTAFGDDPVYRVLHLTVARLFAGQLSADLALLRGADQKAKRLVSLCGKWAPSTDRFHDRHTFIASSIAELLHPVSEFDLIDTSDRETYLRHARGAYQKDLALLRAHLEVVERNITTKSYDKIRYDRVPSIAMSKYSGLFAENDPEGFEKYITNVAEGRQNISGATLLPSTLIKSVRLEGSGHGGSNTSSKNKHANQLVAAKVEELKAKVVDGQWKTLVQRIKDSGTLESSIAVCDVSGSMMSPHFPDDTTPMDSAIGLSLLVAEVTAPPFGGAFITFSRNPTVQRVDLKQSLSEKYKSMNEADWDQNTNFVAVFEDLILPMAVQNKLTQEQMVKRIFVFSDMQFDQASRGEKLTTSFERVKKSYAAHGYEMPQLVFWNLAGGRAGYSLISTGDPTAPKPVTVDESGTALVSGYSQGMLKVFLENGGFDQEEDQEEEIIEKSETDEDGDELTVVDRQAKRQKFDPLSTVTKAVSHKAYEMLKVVD